MALTEVGGYVLAGGKSSRMGRDKALLQLGGRPLVWHAVTKLHSVCAEVHILSGNLELEAFAPLVRDLKEGCGPMGGLEAALEDSRHEWSLFMPVDMPFLPAVFLEDWVTRIISHQGNAHVAMFTVNGVPQPLFCLLHREVGPFVREAMQRGRYKVFPVLEGAARELAERHGVAFDEAFVNARWEETGDLFAGRTRGSGQMLTEAQQAAKPLWFANLNTPEEFASAEEHLNALDSWPGVS